MSGGDIVAILPEFQNPGDDSLKWVVVGKEELDWVDTRAVAGDLPPDVLQRLLGHASIQTMRLYVHAERAHSLAQLDAYFEHQAQGRKD